MFRLIVLAFIVLDMMLALLMIIADGMTWLRAGVLVASLLFIVVLLADNEYS